MSQIEPTLACDELPQSVYLHVPFCRHRCGYCNFTLVSGRDHWIDEYLDAIETEIEQTPDVRGKPELDTIFIGGGTPTHLAPSQLRRLFSIVQRQFRLAPDVEFSIEANPSDINDATCEVIANSPVNRVSLGVQSFDQDKLSFLERDHNPQQVALAVELLTHATPNISLDLIFGAQGESLDTWKNDISTALELPIQHVSTYGLTIEKGTQFWNRQSHGRLVECGEDDSAAMYENAIEQLVGAGFDHYEVSNFALAGNRCRHNEAYWTNRSFWAFGPGAAAYRNGIRTTNHRSVKSYLKRIEAGLSPVAFQEKLSREDSAREQLVFGLRRLEGVHERDFFRQTGFQIEELLGPKLSELIQREFLSNKNGRLQLTRAGLMVSDSIWPDFL